MRTICAPFRLIPSWANISSWMCALDTEKVRLTGIRFPEFYLIRTNRKERWIQRSHLYNFDITKLLSFELKASKSQHVLIKQRDCFTPFGLTGRNHILPCHICYWGIIVLRDIPIWYLSIDTRHVSKWIVMSRNSVTLSIRRLASCGCFRFRQRYLFVVFLLDWRIRVLP